ncbi:hypothetical protein LJC74_02665 [Eubacteriales bacterium OttesenSCG-928-A19]|nr:hypothetical protein [Eubacteriales bacterium OttesenSCG-928-A19]
MKSDRLVIGLDFGTLSGRAVLVRVEDGGVLAEASAAYAHGVMDRQLPDGTPLGRDWALQHPSDYLDALTAVVPEVMRLAAARPEQVIGLGVDFTGSTVVALDGEGVPLCLREEYRDRPHAWVKLWKHHAADREAREFTRAAREMDEDLLARNGGRISSECLFPKVLQAYREDPALYAATESYMEAADWVTMQLTGLLVRSASCAAMKAFWRVGRGYPDDAFLCAVDPGLRGFPEAKLRGALRGLGERAGLLTEGMAARLGLLPGTAVAVAQFDAQAAVPALGITGPGVALVTLGTSLAISVAGDGFYPVQGICSRTEGGNLPGYVGYASGQCSVGDLLGWYVEGFVPTAYTAERRACGMDMHALLTEKAAPPAPDESTIRGRWDEKLAIL